MLVRENADRTMVYIRSIVRSSAEAEDVFQEAMLVAFRRLGDFDRSRPFGPWVRGIAAKVALARARKAAASPAIDPAIIDGISREMEQWDSFDRLRFEGVLERLAECMQRLSADQQECLHLAYRLDAPLRTIAEQLSVAEETIKKRLQRARANLADCLQAHGAMA